MANDLAAQTAPSVCVLWTSSSHNLTYIFTHTHAHPYTNSRPVHLHVFILMVMESARAHSELIRGVIARTSLPKPAAWRRARERTCAYHKARDVGVCGCDHWRGWIMNVSRSSAPGYSATFISLAILHSQRTARFCWPTHRSSTFRSCTAMSRSARSAATIGRR